jgi:hypothetical protein
MTTTELNHEELDEILREVEPDHIPAEFIQGARITTAQGRTRVIDSEELEEIMSDESSLESLGIIEVRVILDMVGIKRSILEYSEQILNSIPK